MFPLPAMWLLSTFTSCPAGVFEMQVYKDPAGGADVTAMVSRVRHGKFLLPAPLETAKPVEEVMSDFLNTFMLRVHDQCHTSEIFGSTKCDCKLQLDASLAALHATSVAAYARRAAARKELHSSIAVSPLPEGESNEGAGAIAEGKSSETDAWAHLSDDHVIGLILYLPQEGRGIGLAAKISAYALQESPDGHIAGFTEHEDVEGWGETGTIAGNASREGASDDESLLVISRPAGLDTVDANRALGLPDDARQYTAVPLVLDHLGLLKDNTRELVLMTNNPRKLQELGRLGIRVKGAVSCLVEISSPLASAYVSVKAQRMGHVIPKSDISAE
jgi:GTP cyclohydrolase II